ncbi:MAG: hypothetical protein CMC14_14195 [Flavobacteriaceae bacterium]|nr:hypothetical protein [Flavobacteriaceae bacterium]|tara:strand:- start:102 stop:467 length:366 start_codon:yes stop_codon:yes gene_type:complete
MKRQPTIEIPPMPHIGKLFRDYVEENRIYQSVLAKILGKTQSVLLRYRFRKSLQCYLLWELSVGLKHNFFMDVASQLPDTYSTSAPDVTLPYKERIAALEKELETVTRERDLLKEVIVQKG